VWIFDQTDGSGRVLHERNGHSEPPVKVRFHGNDGKCILSAGIIVHFGLKFALVTGQIQSTKCLLFQRSLGYDKNQSFQISLNTFRRLLVLNHVI